MAVDVMKSGLAVGVGVLDEVMESWDEKEGRVEPFRNATDISRILIAGLGYGLQMFMPRYARLGEGLALAGTPLLVKSIAAPLREAIGGGGASRFVPRGNAFRPARAPMSGSPSGVGFNPGKPEFSDAKLL